MDFDDKTASSAKLIQIIRTFLWSILAVNSLIAAMFFFVIFGVLLSRSSNFNLVYPLILIPLGGTLMEITTLGRFFGLSPLSEI